jgi:hypothetical protein
MKTKPAPLPPAFVAYVIALLHKDRSSNIRRVRRFVILKWGFWLDGIAENSIPGYATCPPADERVDHPAGWTVRAFCHIARKALGTDAVLRKGQRAVPADPRRHDCGSGHDYGICPACGKGHGYTLFSAASFSR